MSIQLGAPGRAQPAATGADDGVCAGATELQWARCACGLAGAAAIDASPSFPYECRAEGGGKSGGSVLCAVCLEDMQRGEAVRQLLACGHMFHAECITASTCGHVAAVLHSHTTCPL